MTTYEPVPEPAGPLWTRDDVEGVRRWRREERASGPMWVSNDDDLLYWKELLDLRPSDHHPDLPEGVTSLPRYWEKEGALWFLNGGIDEDTRDFVLRAVRREVERIEAGEPVREKPATEDVDAEILRTHSDPAVRDAARGVLDERWELLEARRERNGMQQLAKRNREEADRLRAERDRLAGFVRQLVDAGRNTVHHFTPLVSGESAKAIDHLRAVIERVADETEHEETTQ